MSEHPPGIVWLREAMRRIESHETEGIACWRLNRFARNVAGAIDDVKRRAIERGAKISPTPYGYQRQDDGTLTPHPDQAPHVTEAYRISAAQDLSTACLYLAEHVHRAASPDADAQPRTSRSRGSMLTQSI